MGDNVVGVLYVNYHKPHTFTKDELETIGAFASQASIAIQNAEHMQELAKARERFRRLYEAAREIIRAELDERSILGAALRVGMERTGAFSATARLLDVSGKWLETIERLGKTYEGAWKPIAVGKGVNGWVAQHRETLLVNVDHMPDEIGKWEGHPGTRWKLVVPMIAGGKYFGNLGFDCGSEQLFEEDEVLLVEGIADQAAAALQRLRQKRRAEEAERHQAAMDQLTMLQTLRTNLIHGFAARRLVPLREIAMGLRAELDKGVDQIDREIVYEMLHALEGSAQDSLEELRKIMDLPTRTIQDQATLVDINVQIQGAYRYTLDSKPENVQVEFSFTEDLPKIKIDPLQLSIIFENLFVNAYEALKDWGGERRLTVTTFKAPADEGVTKIGTKFSNTGPPVPESVAERLFKTPIGEGMGLYTSAWVLALYGGTISLTENKPGRLTFVVEFDVKGGQ
jgi:GAF domain-containing protein